MKFDSEKLWYCSFATDKDRVKAISNPKCAADALDKKRADYILEHTRIMRLFVHCKCQHTFVQKVENFFVQLPVLCFSLLSL